MLIKEFILVSWFSRARNGANFPPIVAMLGSLSFSRLNLILMVPWFFILWRRSLKVIITRSWSLPISAPGLCNVHIWMEALFDHDVVDPIAVVSSWAVPCSEPRWFVCDQMCSPPTCCCIWWILGAWSLFRWFAILAECPLPHLAFILSYLCIPVTLHCKEVIRWHLVYDFLQLIIEVFNVIIIVVSCWGISLDDGDVKRWWHTSRWKHFSLWRPFPMGTDCDGCVDKWRMPHAFGRHRQVWVSLSPLLYIAHLTHPSQSVPIVVYCPPYTSITICPHCCILPTLHIHHNLSPLLYCPPYTSITICPHCCILPTLHIHHNLSPLLYIAHLTHPSQSVPIVVYCPPYTSITICPHCCILPTLHIHHNLSPLLYIAHLTHPSQSVPIAILPTLHIHHSLSLLTHQSV